MKKSNYTSLYKDIKKYGIDYAVKHTVDAGYDAVELFDNAKPVGWIQNKETFCQLQEKLISNNLDVSCYSVLVNLLSDNVGEMLEYVHEHIERAAKIGSPYFHHTLAPTLKFTDCPFGFDEVFERVVDNAEKIALWCNQNNLVCLYEPQGKYFNGIDNLKRLVDEMRSRGRNVGVCGDVGNPMFADCKPSELFAFFKDDIKHVHIKDYSIAEHPSDGSYTTLGGRYLIPVPIGEGDADVKSCIKHLEKYQGYFSIESEESDDRIKQMNFIGGK